MHNTERQLLVSLSDLTDDFLHCVGSKAANLAKLQRDGHRVPPGFCITTDAYQLVVDESGIARRIAMELERKSMNEMRWEEIWDSALRIRSLFLNCEIPHLLLSAIQHAYGGILDNGTVAVRSSALGEDTAGLSFAGLHESVVDVKGLESVLEAVRVVWASLWSDAALLYRREMSLDPGRSKMGVIIQQFSPGGPSGVIFSQDPRGSDSDTAILEAVPGHNSDLVDGIVDPDRWVISRETGAIRKWTPGKRSDGSTDVPLLEQDDVSALLGLAIAIERAFGWAADVEWTGRKDERNVLQARPITSVAPNDDDEERRWYLSLRPGARRLKALADRVSGELIPELESDGSKMAQQDLDSLSDRELSKEIKQRLATLRRWKKIYTEEFIPLAHGVRQLGIYYNNAIKPADPFEFMGLLSTDDLLAAKRNQRISELANVVRSDTELKEILSDCSAGTQVDDQSCWASAVGKLQLLESGQRFLRKLDSLMSGEADVAYRGERLAEQPAFFIHTILELSASARFVPKDPDSHTVNKKSSRYLEQQLLMAVGGERAQEVLEILELGRLSWKLRDDDNLLVGRIESQLIRALEIATNRLKKRGQLNAYERLTDRVSLILAEALIYPPENAISLPEQEEIACGPGISDDTKARQIVGQPAGSGVASGKARIVSRTEDLLRFKAGEVLVCDAIQPTMTHIVPLACAIVERRGGMLIHGAIIARELGIPCVNGVSAATKVIENGELVTVDGYLGIVTIGLPEFSIEMGAE